MNARMLIVMMVAFLAGCETVGGILNNGEGHVIEKTAVNVFIPIDPVVYDEYFSEPLEFSDGDNSGKVGDSNSDWLSVFPVSAVDVTVGQITSEYGLTFPFATLSTENGKYLVTVDYTKYRTDTVEGDGDSHVIAKSGVGVRLKASIVSNEAGVNLSSIYGIGMAAKRGEVTGTLYFEVIGIHGSVIDALIPVPSELSMESIQSAMQSIAAIKSKMYDTNEVYINPTVFAEKTVSKVNKDKSNTARPN